jgi:hypothetical protein
MQEQFEMLFWTDRDSPCLGNRETIVKAIVRHLQQRKEMSFLVLFIELQINMKVDRG